MKKVYTFTANGSVTGRGYVSAENASEALKLIQAEEYTDIFDEDISYDFQNVKITGEDAELEM